MVTGVETRHVRHRIWLRFDAGSGEVALHVARVFLDACHHGISAEVPALSHGAKRHA